jgi:DNA-binding CsgD family transcriptional regulator/PAS domain-containing protein
MTMDLSLQLSALIGDIHDAALDRSRWSEVVGRAGRFVGGRAAAIFSKSAVAGSGDVHYEFGTDPYYRQLYFEKYVRLDPATAGHHFAEPGEPMAVEDLMPYPEFTQTQFYREWAQPQGIVDFVSAVLDKSPTGASMFGVFRYEYDGIVDSEARRRMRLVVPHIRRAVIVGRLLELKSSGAAAFEALDGLGAGVCLLDASGKIIHANAACQAILDADDFLSAAGGRLVAKDFKVDQALRELVAAAAAESETPIRAGDLPLRAQDGTRHVMHALPLAPAVRGPVGTAASVALFIRKAAIEPPAAPDVIARAYNLTPAELRVLLAITQIGGVGDVAAAFRVAETTIKTHLGRLFVKTGARRQADLVKIVAGFAMPFAIEPARG